MRHGITNEITRIALQGIKRSEVKESYNFKGGDALAMNVTVDLNQGKKGAKIDVIFRRCNQVKEKGEVNDVRIKDIY